LGCLRVQRQSIPLLSRVCNPNFRPTLSSLQPLFRRPAGKWLGAIRQNHSFHRPRGDGVIGWSLVDGGAIDAGRSQGEKQRLQQCTHGAPPGESKFMLERLSDRQSGVPFRLWQSGVIPLCLPHSDRSLFWLRSGFLFALLPSRHHSQALMRPNCRKPSRSCMLSKRWRARNPVYEFLQRLA
jgi:hypothetical protein